MARIYFLFLLVVIFQSSANDKGYYVVDNGLASSPYNPNSIRMDQKPSPFQHLFNKGYYDYHLLTVKENIVRKPGLHIEEIHWKNSNVGQRVNVQVYYECLCPDCRSFDSGPFKDTVLALGSNLLVKVYPYGNAQTDDRNGHVQFTCQHGPAECYGNKLHACAIFYLRNITASVLYNSCMMDSTQAGQGSDDAAADVCAKAMGIDSSPIKQCAKDSRGTTLLWYFGIESKKANFNEVPYILIDGVQNSGDNFMKDVCKAFKNPPPACNGHLF